MKRLENKSEVESIVLNAFKNAPFHNLHLLEGTFSNIDGGTCSDKSLSFLRSVQDAGYRASLHSANIGGKKDIHRLVKVHINERTYFADIGNGWPSLELYPLDREVDYSCYGMRFRTQIDHEKITVFHTRNGKTNSGLEIYFECKSENEILTDIANRYDGSTQYPFTNRLRFSKVVGDEFLFLRGDRLEIYKEGNEHASTIDAISKSEVPDILSKYFHFDLHSSPIHRGENAE